VSVVSKNRAKQVLRVMFASGLCSFLATNGSASPKEGQLASTAQANALETVLEPVVNAESKTLWLIENYSFQGKSLLLSLAGLQAQDPLGLSVVVLDPPPQTKINEAMSALKTASQGQAPAKTGLPLKDVSNAAQGAGNPTSPKVTVHLRATTIKMADIEVAKKDLTQHMAPCGPTQRRAVAFIRSEDIVKHLNVTTERALEWSQYGRAACVEWNALPDPSPKSSDQTAFLPL
jgi:hypothetical protein